MKKFLFLLLALLPIMASAQWAITPDGTLVDSITGDTHMIIEREGTAAELYKQVLKNVHRLFASPDDVVSSIENEMITVNGYTETTLKYAGFNHSFEPLISVKVEFKDGRMRVSAKWLSTVWCKTTVTDPYTLLVKGGLKCFNKEGEIKNEKRYHIFNAISSDFINRVIEVPTTDEATDDDW